jgi:hypothetical protein
MEGNETFIKYPFGNIDFCCAELIVTVTGVVCPEHRPETVRELEEADEWFRMISVVKSEYDK